MDENHPPYVIHDTPTKNRFIGAVEAGLNIPSAAALIGLPASTAYKIAAKYKATGSTSNRRRSGRPKKLSEAGKRLLTRTAVKERRMPLGELANTLQLNVSASTVRRALAEKGYHRRVARKRPYLRKDQKRSRMRWAKLYEQWDNEAWGRVIF
ncbi:putative encoded by [Lyophyllum shimeji]|uniref:Encoded by n=1 Tax=Lyophyllum shimeji TaxID=47721 RepID=A0A9P3PVX9_LYOSH|nr:putative encoded by [Lyophyllum shimeji]